MTTITQADRDAAAAHSKHNGRPQQAANIRRGTSDGIFIVKAFARHREEAEERGRIEGARIALDAAAKMVGFDGFLQGCRNPYDTTLAGAMKQIENAIRALDPETIIKEARSHDRREGTGRRTAGLYSFYV